jgi:hypothetical protein
MRVSISFLLFLVICLTTQIHSSSCNRISNIFGVQGTNSKSSHIIPSSTTLPTGEIDEKLLKDIEMLSNMLSNIVKRENPHVHQLYNELRQLGIERAFDPNNTKAFEKMKKLSRDITPHDALGILRVFSLALNLVNAAEVHNNLRAMREHELNDMNKAHVGPLPMVEDSVRGTIETILDNKEGDEEAIYEFLCKQKVEIVLTAHPTEGKCIIISLYLCASCIMARALIELILFTVSSFSLFVPCLCSISQP